MKTALWIYVCAALSFGAIFYQADRAVDRVLRPYEYVLISAAWPLMGGALVVITLLGADGTRWQR